MANESVGIFHLFGQSNMLGTALGSVPVGIPDSSILYNYWNYLGNDFSSLQSLQADPIISTAHGPELQFGLGIKALGAFDKVVINKVAKGATSISDWRPGGPELLCDTLIRKAQECVTWITALYPTCSIRHFLHAAIGETDAAGSTPPTLWAENFLLTQQALETALGLTQPFKPVLSQVNANQTSNQNLAIARSEIIDAAFYVVNNDDLFPPGGLHYDNAQQNIIGARHVVGATRVIYMAVTHPTAVRNATADQVVDSVDVSGPGKLIIRAGSTVLATVILANPAFGPASGGVATLLGVPRNATASGSGTADNFLAQDGASTTKFQGSVTATGGGGDLTLASTAIAAGDTVTITGGTYTAPP